MVRYIDKDTEYPQLTQPPRAYVHLAEDELDADEQVTWPAIHKRAWELYVEDNPDEDEIDEIDEIDVAAAIDAAQHRSAPDDAPTCSEPGCQRLGVIAQTVTTARGTQWWHWCVTHDPER